MNGFSTTRAWVGFFAALVAPIGAIGDARVQGAKRQVPGPEADDAYLFNYDEVLGDLT